MTKRRLSNAYDRAEAAIYPKMHKSVKEYLDEQALRLAKAYKKYHRKENKQEKLSEEQAQRIADEIIANYMNWNEEVSSLFMNLYPELIKSIEQGNLLSNLLFHSKENQVVFSTIRTEALEFIQEYGLEQSKLITNTTREVTKDAITKGLVNGDSTKSIAEGIRAKNAGLSVGRAKTIVNTEIHTTFMKGRELNYIKAGFTHWKWITSRDESVRGNKRTDTANHVILDNKIVPIGQPFVENLKYPGDPNGRAGQVIGCRCDVMPATSEQYIASITRR